MRQYKLFQQDFGAPPPPPTAPPPPPISGTQGGSASSRAIWALILGIAAWVLCFGTVIPGIIAWVLGKKEINDIEAGLAPQAGKTMAQIGMWLGIINVILSVLAWIAFIILIVFFGVLGTSMNY